MAIRGLRDLRGGMTIRGYDAANPGGPIAMSRGRWQVRPRPNPARNSGAGT